MPSSPPILAAYMQSIHSEWSVALISLSVFKVSTGIELTYEELAWWDAGRHVGQHSVGSLLELHIARTEVEGGQVAWESCGECAGE